MTTNTYKHLLQTMDVRGTILTLLRSQDQVVVSNRYLPEILALVANERAKLIRFEHERTVLGKVE